MTNDEYRQLVEFLTREFGKIEGRFTRIDRRFAQVDAQFVAVRVEIHQQAETFDGKLGEFRREVDAQFGEVKGLIRLVDGRVRRLEERG